MRARNFITEYDRTKTAQAFAAKLVNTALRDPTTPGAVRNNINSMEDPLKAAEMILQNQIEVGDPTKQKKYTQTLARMYANGLIKWEDIGSTMRDYLTKFHKLNLKKMIPNPRNDFNRYTDIGDFYSVVDEYPDPEEREMKSKGDAKEVYKDANVRIIQPEDINAACYYGQGTRWCTAADSNNMFDRYNQDGPMYILLPTPAKYEGEKYQIHPESSQYMDEDDRSVTPKDLMDRFGENFEKWMLKADPYLGGKIIHFLNEDELRSAIEKIKQLAQDKMMDILTDWEMQDDTYYQYLQDEGYVDEEGEYKDDYPGYTDYNDEAQIFYNRAHGALDITVDELRELAQELEDNDGRDQMVSNLEDVISWSVEKTLGDEDGGLTKFIFQRIQTKLDKETGKIDVESTLT